MFPVFAEELVFRGFAFNKLATVYKPGTALAISAALFGLLHATDGQHDLVDAVLIFLRGCLPFGAAFCWTRKIWRPIGLHLGQDLAAAFLFGEAACVLPALTTLAVNGSFISFGLRFIIGFIFPFVAALAMMILAKRRDAIDGAAYWSGDPARVREPQRDNDLAQSA